jgi:hypothetical protein
MDATTWLKKHEEEVLARIAKETETMLMWGHSPYAERKRIAITVTQDLWRQGKITLDESKTLCNMINSSAADNLDLAVTILETLKKGKA